MTAALEGTGTMPDAEIDGIVAQFGNPDTCTAWTAAKDAVRTATAGDGTVQAALAAVVKFERTARLDFGVRYRLGLR